MPEVRIVQREEPSEFTSSALNESSPLRSVFPQSNTEKCTAPYEVYIYIYIYVCVCVCVCVCVFYQCKCLT